MPKSNQRKLHDGTLIATKMLPYAIYDIQEAKWDMEKPENERHDLAQFFAHRNLQRYKTNMICDGMLPYPQHFHLMAISTHVFGNPTAEDKETIDRCMIEMSIAGCTYFALPVYVSNFQNINWKTAKELWGSIGKYKEIDKEHSYPLGLPEEENDTIVIPPLMDFRVRLGSQTRIVGCYDIAILLHGYLERPIV